VITFAKDNLYMQQINIKVKYICKFATERIYGCIQACNLVQFLVHKIVTSPTEQITGFGMRTVGFNTVKKNA
jgi:hypothetical protein